LTNRYKRDTLSYKRAYVPKLRRETNMKKTIFLTLILTLALIACDNDGGGGSGGGGKPEQPVPKTYTITLKEGQLKFNVKYTDLPNKEPAYLTYLKTRLTLISNATSAPEIAAVNNLINNGGSNHTITVEYTGSSYEGIKWNATSRTFTIHNDWITTATGTDLSGAMLRNAFNAVEAD